MTQDDEAKIALIQAHESDLVELYGEVYPVLKGADLSEMPDKIRADVRDLEPADKIGPAKAAAVLKSICGSTSEDRFAFEYCFNVPTPSGQALGSFVRARLREIGVSYGDFSPYLRQHGWYVEAGQSST